MRKCCENLRMETKRCARCGSQKVRSDFSPPAPARPGAWCKACKARHAREKRGVDEDRFERERLAREARGDDPKTRHAAYRREYYRANKDQWAVRREQWRAANADRRRETDKVANALAASRLSTTYVKRLLTAETRLPFAGIPEELVETKRLHLTIKRGIRAIDKALNQTEKK
jgi:hypothetical protein